MADTLVERLTGQAAAADVNIEVHLLMPLNSLLNPQTPHRPRWRDTARSRPALPTTSCTPAGAGCGGGGCSPPRPAAR